MDQLHIDQFYSKEGNKLTLIVPKGYAREKVLCELSNVMKDNVMKDKFKHVRTIINTYETVKNLSDKEYDYGFVFLCDGYNYVLFKSIREIKHFYYVMDHTYRLDVLDNIIESDEDLFKDPEDIEKRVHEVLSDCKNW